MNIIVKKILLSFFFVFLISCQDVELLDEIVFDNSQLNKLNFNAEQKIINNLYEISYSEPYIDHSIDYTPLFRLNSWLEENMVVFGTENKLIINIFDASITRIEREKENKKKFEKKSEYFYEINFFINFMLYDDNEQILARSETRINRSTTSDKFISINQKENIIDNLILDALIDVSNKSEELLKIHMTDYIL